MKWILLFLMALAGPAFSAIAHDGTAVTGQGIGSGVFVSYTTSTGSNRCFVVASESRGSTNQTISAISLGGSNLVREVSKMYSGGGTNAEVEYWYLLNPPASTTSALSITFTGSERYAFSAQDYSGVNQTTPFGSVTSTAITTGTALTTAFSTMFNSSWILCEAISYNNASMTLDSQLTTLFNFNNSGAGGNATSSGDFATTSAGAYSVTNTQSASIVLAAQQMVELVEAGYPTYTPTFTPTVTPTITPTVTPTPTPTTMYWNWECSGHGQ